MGPESQPHFFLFLIFFRRIVKSRFPLFYKRETVMYNEKAN